MITFAYIPKTEKRSYTLQKLMTKSYIPNVDRGSYVQYIFYRSNIDIDICVYIYIHNTYIHTHIYIYISMYIYIYTYVCVHALRCCPDLWLVEGESKWLL